MALPLFEEDMEIISKLGTRPKEDNGVSESQLKALFDRGGMLIKKFLNETLIPQMNMTIDVQHLLNGILDKTLSKEDKAANAYATGEAIKKVSQVATAAIPKAGGEMSGNLSVPAPVAADHAVNKGYVDTKRLFATLFADGWSAGEAPYFQRITVSNLTDRKTVNIYPVYTGTDAEKRAMQDACGCVSYCESDGEKMTFWCLNDRPEVDISISVEVGV